MARFDSSPTATTYTKRSRSQESLAREDNRAIVAMLELDQNSKSLSKMTEAQRIEKYQIYVEQLESLISGNKLDLIDHN